MKLAKKISKAELEVMRILWREKRPLSFADLRGELQQSKGWEKSTVNTLIRRLVEKQAVSASRQGVLHYTPNLTEADYTNSEEQEMIDRLYSGSAKHFVAALCRRGQLSEADIDELKRTFRVGGEGA